MTTSNFYTAASGDDGHILSKAEEDWELARDGYALAEATTGVGPGCGSTYAKTSGKFYYSIWESFVRFNTASIPDADTISSATFKVTINDNGGAPTEDVQVRAIAWTDPLDTTDWKSHSTFSAGTLVAHGHMADFVAAQEYAFTSESAFPAAVNKTGYTYLVFAGEDFEGGTYSGLTYWRWYAYDNGSLYPCLTVEHSGEAAPVSLVVTNTIPAGW